jgi:hypothetical protein
MDAQMIENVMGIIGGLIAVATAITAMTDTPEDDKIVSKIRKIVALLSVTKFKDSIKDPAKPTTQMPVVSGLIGMLKKRKG